MNLFRIILISLFCLSFFSCDEDKEVKPQSNMTKEQSSELNKSLNKDVLYQIDDYIQRNGWKVEETGTGVKYMIYKQGEGLQAEPGLIALINFEMTLLDGTVCYSSKVSGPKSFKIEQSDLETGLFDAIVKMKVGDKAKIILPHFRAHGLIGDSRKIPPLSPVIYDVELKSLSKN